jgi:hypothetical protein
MLRAPPPSQRRLPRGGQRPTLRTLEDPMTRRSLTMLIVPLLSASCGLDDPGSGAAAPASGREWPSASAALLGAPSGLDPAVGAGDSLAETGPLTEATAVVDIDVGGACPAVQYTCEHDYPLEVVSFGQNVDVVFKVKKVPETRATYSICAEGEIKLKLACKLPTTASAGCAPGCKPQGDDACTDLPFTALEVRTIHDSQCCSYEGVKATGAKDCVLTVPGGEEVRVPCTTKGLEARCKEEIQDMTEDERCVVACRLAGSIPPDDCESTCRGLGIDGGCFMACDPNDQECKFRCFKSPLSLCAAHLEGNQALADEFARVSAVQHTLQCLP